MSNIDQIFYPGYGIALSQVGQLFDHTMYPLVFGLCNEYNLKIGAIRELSSNSGRITLVNDMGFTVAVVDQVYGKIRGDWGYPIRLHRAFDTLGETRDVFKSVNSRYLLRKARTDHEAAIAFRSSVRKLRETAVPDILRRLVSITAQHCVNAVSRHDWTLSPSTMESLLRFYHGVTIPADIPEKDQVDIALAWSQIQAQADKRIVGRNDIESALNREKWLLFYNRATKAYIVGAVNTKVYVPFALAAARSERSAADFQMDSFVTIPFRAYYDLDTLPQQFKDSLMGTLVVNKMSRQINNENTRPMDPHEFFLTHSTGVFNPDMGTVEYCSGRTSDGVMLIDKASA
jgi:hypothetical protein